MDEKISGLFQDWLSAFEAVQVASGENAIVTAHTALSDIEARLAETPAEGMQGLAVKLGLHCFLNDHADAASIQSEFRYRDLVRLTGQIRLLKLQLASTRERRKPLAKSGNDLSAAGRSS